MTRDQIAQKFDQLWTRLRIQSHIVQALKKKSNTKQALEKAENFNRIVREEIIQDLVGWISLNPQFSEIEDQKTFLHDEVMHRINCELSKLDVPAIPIAQRE